MFCFLQLIGKLEETYGSMPSILKEALCADPDDIVYTSLRDVRIHYDDGTTGPSGLLEVLQTKTKNPDDSKTSESSSSSAPRLL